MTPRLMLSGARNLQTLSARFPPLSDGQFRQALRQQGCPPHLGHDMGMCRIRHALTAVEVGRGVAGAHLDAGTIDAVGGTSHDPSGWRDHPPVLFEQFQNLKMSGMRLPVVGSVPIPRHRYKTIRRGRSSQALTMYATGGEIENGNDHKRTHTHDCVLQASALASPSQWVPGLVSCWAPCSTTSHWGSVLGRPWCGLRVDAGTPGLTLLRHVHFFGLAPSFSTDIIVTDVNCDRRAPMGEGACHADVARCLRRLQVPNLGRDWAPPDSLHRRVVKGPGRF